MERAHNLLQKLQTDQNVFGSLKLKISFEKESEEEGFTARLGHKILNVTASSPLSALFAWHKLKFAYETGTLKEHMQERPKFSSRIFWPQGPLEEIFENSKATDAIASRLIEWGYNAVVLNRGSQHFQSYGLKVYAKRGADEPCDGVLVELEAENLPARKNSTYYERLLDLIKKQEKQIPRGAKLLLVLPSSLQSKVSLRSLIDDVSEKTEIVFSMHAKGFYEDWQPINPFWNTIANLRAPSGTPLLCTLNAGSVGFGEGLWPAFPFDLFDQGLSRMTPESFGGALVMATSFPKEEGLLSCQLWMAAEKLWSMASSDILAEQWFKAKKVKWDYSFWKEWLHEARGIAKILGKLQGQPLTKSTKELNRHLTESVFSRIKVLEEITRSYPEKRGNEPSILEYFSFFIRDAKRYVLTFFHAFNLPLSSVLTGVDDGQEGFWTRPGARGSPPLILETPNKGSQGSRMALIYAENRNLPACIER